MSQPLQYSQPLFLEERPVGQWLGRTATVLGVILLVLLIGAVVFACVVWRRAPNWSRGLMLFEILLFVAILLLGRQSTAVTVLEPDHLQLRLSFAGVTFWKRTINLKDVKSVEADERLRFSQRASARRRRGSFHDRQDECSIDPPSREHRCRILTTGGVA